MKISDLENKLRHNKFIRDSLEENINKINESSQSLYHGTNADFEEFDYSYLGKGKDQFGYGFYFTTKKDTARGYGKKIIHADVELKNPIIVNGDSDRGYPLLTKNQVLKMISMAPDLEDTLWNFGDIGTVGLEKVLKSAVSLYLNYSESDSKAQFFAILNDFYGNNPEDFNKNYNKVTGYDGVIVKWNNGEEFHVAWFKNQIKIKK